MSTNVEISCIFDYNSSDEDYEEIKVFVVRCLYVRIYKNIGNITYNKRDKYHVYRVQLLNICTYRENMAQHVLY